MEEAVPVASSATAVPAYGEYPDKARRTLITVGLVLTTLMTSIDGTIANSVLPQIKSSVSASQDEILWVLTSFILAGTIVTPAIGWTERRFGRRLLLLTALVGFTVASVLCGIATGIIELVIYRVLQGATAAVFIPLSQAILLDINPPKDHARAMSVWGMGAVLGPIIGPVLGGVLTENLNWRWVFFINLPFGIVAAVIVGMALSEPARTSRPSIDVAGAVSLTAAITLVLIGLTEGAQFFGWLHPATIGAFAAATVLLAVFVAVERRAADPIVPMDLLQDRVIAISTISGILVGMALFGTMAFLPLFAQGVLGVSATMAGSA